MPDISEYDISEILFQLSELENDVLQLESKPDTKNDFVHLIFRKAHNLKSRLGMLNKNYSKELIHNFETYFDSLRNGLCDIEKGCIDAWLKAIDLIKHNIQEEENIEETKELILQLGELHSKAIVNGAKDMSGEILSGLSPDEKEILNMAVSQNFNIYLIEKPVKTIITEDKFKNLPVYETINNLGMIISSYPKFSEIDKTKEEIILRIIFASEMEEKELSLNIFDVLKKINTQKEDTKKNHSIDKELFEKYYHEVMELLDNSEKNTLELEKHPSDANLISEIFRNIHTIKGNSGFLGFPDIEKKGMEFENILSDLRSKKTKPDSKTITNIFSNIDFIRKSLEILYCQVKEPEKIEYKPIGKILVEMGKVSKEIVEDALNTQNLPIGEILVEKGIIKQENVDEALGIQKNINEKLTPDQVHQKKYIRVDVDKLDKTFDLLSELMTSGSIVSTDFMSLGKLNNIDMTSMVSAISFYDKFFKDLNKIVLHKKENSLEEKMEEIKKILKLTTKKLGKTNSITKKSNEYLSIFNEFNLDKIAGSINSLNKITRELQEISMTTRMIPLDELFSKMNRLVRDLSKKFDKNIKMSISGQETEMDKNIIEMISDPLLHILRNSIDHGVEDSKTRKMKNKEETGNIKLSAKYEGSEVWIIVEDDGAGLNREKIISKAKEKGFFKGDENKIPDEEIWSIIFEPGFSTKEVVTDISGRGVGMDVVKKNIEKLRGKIEIKSKKDRGTTMILKIPLTLAIIDGITIRVGDGIFTIPISDIVEFLRAEDKNITITENKKEVLRVREDILPVIKLYEVFKSKNNFTKIYSEGIIIIVQDSKSKKVCFFIDEIIGNQQIVIKSLSEYLGNIKGVAGCSVLGDGNVSLVLDTGRIISEYLE
jgi:two-component system, chemotaxis family, sensor kinase CheA